MNPKIVPLSPGAPVSDPVDWQQRRNEIREHEWRIYKKAIRLIEQRLDRFLQCPFEKVTIRDLCALVTIGLNLGRAAVDLPQINWRK